MVNLARHGCLPLLIFFLTFGLVTNAQTTTTPLVPTGCDEFVLYFSRCTKPLDVIFLLDSSSSISAADYLVYKTWLADSIYKLVPETTRIGVAQFSTLLQIEFHLDKYAINDETESEALARFANYQMEIMDLERVGGLTRTQYALEQTRLLMWPRADDERNHLTVIVTDGRPSFGQDPCVELALYKDLGIDYTLIGIGAEVEQYIDTFCADQDVLADLQANMVLINDFNALYGAEESIGNLLCPVGTLFDGYYVNYDVGSGTTWRNGRPTYGSLDNDPPIYVYFDGERWVFDTDSSDSEVLGFTDEGDSNLWPTAVYDWQYTDETGDVFVYSGGEIVFGDVECTGSSYALYTIGGTVTGLTGDATVDLALSLGDIDSTLSSNADFRFDISLPENYVYEVRIPTQPTGSVCTISNEAGTLLSNVDDVLVTCAEIYDILGTATNIPSPITIFNGADSIVISEGGAWTIFDTVNEDDSYVVQIPEQPDGYTCTVTNGAGVTPAADVTGVLVDCQPNIPEDYDVSGVIEGLVSGSVTLTNGGDSVVVSEGSTDWTIIDTVAHGSDYAVYVSQNPIGYTCEVTALATGVATSNIIDAEVVCTQDQYTISGTTITVAFEGLTDGSIDLALNGGSDLNVPGGFNSFTFQSTLVYGDDFDVRISDNPPGQSCTITNGEGTVTGNIDNVQIICVATVHTVGGTANTIPVSGLSDGVVQVSLNGGDEISVSGDNQGFTFSDSLIYGTDHSVSIVSQPVGQTCTVTNGSGQIVGDVNDIVIDCVLNEHTVSGESSTIVTDGLSDGTIEISLNSGDPISVPGGDSTFTFPDTVTFGDLYAVTIAEQPVGQTCIVQDNFGFTSSDVTNIVITCVPTEHSISGTITGLDGSEFTEDVSVTISNSNGDVIEVPEQVTSFTFPSTVPFGDTYAISISEQPDGYQCSVTSGEGTVSADVTDVSIVCIESSLVQLGGSYSSVVIDDLTSGELSIESDDNSLTLSGGDSSFNFGRILHFNEPYEVTITSNPVGQTCVVTNGAGTAFDADILDVRIDCTPNQHSISGDVSGLETGQTVTISNGGDSIEVDDAFTFPSTVEFGGDYEITITDQPDGVDCQLRNPSGIVTGGDVGNVVVICDVIEYSISGTVVGLDPTEYLPTVSSIIRNTETGEALLFRESTDEFTFNNLANYGDLYNLNMLTQPTGHSCVVEPESGTVTGNVDNIVITCTQNLVDVGGLSSSLVIDGLTDGEIDIALNTDQNSMTLEGGVNQPFAFEDALSYNQPYEITIVENPPGQTCSINSAASGIATDVDISSVLIACSAIPYTIGGIVSGLEDGQGTVTLEMGGTSITSDGTFTFPNELEFGQPYSISISSTPSDYNCEISNGAGILEGHVSNVVITCIAHPTVSPSGIPSRTPTRTPSGTPTTDSPTTTPSMNPTSDSPSRNPVTPPPSVSPSESPVATPRPSFMPSLTPSFSSCNPYDLYYETAIDEPTAAITTIATTSVQHCGNICRDTLETCDAFQYEVDTGVCTLFQTGEIGVHDNVNFVFSTPGYISGWGRCDAERADYCQLSYGNISRVNEPHFHIHEAGFNPSDPNALRFIVEVHPSYFDILLAFDNKTACGSNYTVELGHPFTGQCDTTRWRAIDRLNGSNYCDNELYQLDVPFWDFVVGGEGGVRVMESYTDEFGVLHDDPNYYYLGFIITMDAKQPLRQVSGDRVWEEIRDVYDAVPMVIRLERTAQASTAIVVFLGDYDYITVGAVVEHVSVVNNYGFQVPYGSSTFDVRTRSQYPYMFAESDEMTTISMDVATAKSLNGVPQTATASIRWIGEEGVCQWVEGNPWSDVCDQLWEITVQPDACYIDGDYIVNFKATCFRNKTCEVPDSQTGYVSMTFQLTSSNFCPVVVDDIGLQGALYFTGAENYAKEDRTFAIFADDTVHFRSEVYSPEAVITNSTLVSITATWEQGGTTSAVQIWDEDTAESDIGLVPYYPTKFGDMEKIDLMPFDSDHIQQVSNTENGFSFVVDRRIFPVPGDGSGVLTVTCTVAIAYEGGLSQRRRLTARRQIQNDYQPGVIHPADMNHKLSGPAVGVTRKERFFPYDESHVHQGSVHFYIQIRVQKDIMARHRFDGGKLLHVLTQTILEFAQITEGGFNLDRVDACEPQIMLPGSSSWRECDTIFADESLLGTNADYMPLSRNGLHYIDKNVLQIWGTFLQSTLHPEPMRNWNHFQNALVDVDSPFYGTSLFHSSTLVEAQARDAARPVEEQESSACQRWVFINFLTFTIALLMSF